METQTPKHSADRGKEQFDAKSASAVVGSAVHALLSNPRGVPALVAFSRVCSGSALRAGAGAYRGWFFAGDNPVFPEGSFDRGDVSMFSSGAALKAVTDRGNAFDAIPAIREKMIRLVRASVSAVDVDGDSRRKLREARVRAAAEGLKLVVLGTHASHFDAAAYEAALFAATDGEVGLDGPLRVRMLGGAYMFYNKSVRVFTPAHHTHFVFGPTDAVAVLRALKGYGRGAATHVPDALKPKNSTTDGGASDAEWVKIRDEDKEGMEVFRTAYPRAVEEGYGTRRDEVMVVFPYAGRGTERYKPFGIKSSLPKGIAGQLSHPRALYLPVSLAGTPSILETGRQTRLWGPINAFGRGPVSLRVGEAFRGADFPSGQAGMARLHAEMCRVSYANLASFVLRRGGAMPERVPDDVLAAAAGAESPAFAGPAVL